MYLNHGFGFGWSSHALLPVSAGFIAAETIVRHKAAASNKSTNTSMGSR